MQYEAKINYSEQCTMKLNAEKARSKALANPIISAKPVYRAKQGESGQTITNKQKLK